MSKFIEYPYSDLTKIPESGGMYELIKNHYWVRTSKGNVLFYGKLHQSPQCNSNRSIVERWLSQHQDSEIVFAENAWVKINISDYI